MATVEEINTLLKTTQLAAKAKKTADAAFDLAYANKLTADADKKAADEALIAALENSANL